MTEKEFYDYLESYGTALEKWPQHLRAKAEKSLVKDGVLRDLLAAEMELSRAFSVDVPEPDAEFENRILAASYALPQQQSAGENLLPRLTSWRMAASVLIFVVGMALGGLQNDADAADDMLMQYYTGEDGGL